MTSSVFIADHRPRVRDALAQLLSLDPRVTVAGTGRVARGDTHDVVVDTAMLSDLKDVRLGDFIEMIVALGTTRAPRHLRPIQVPAASSELKSVLSAREITVVRQLCEGLTNKQISMRLGLSDKTVKNHVSHVLKKMKLSARTQVAIHALRAGLV
jgi:DNA-binding NarL/FixJ family response regulator